MASFQHILIPVDFTEKNQAALNVALEMAGPFKARITLLHVIEMLDSQTDDELEEFYKSLETKAVENLARLGGDLQKRGVEVASEALLGKRVRTIVEYCLEQSVDLVVLSSHKVDLSRPQESLGTLSHQVSILCQCPVLLVK